jgi:hypothetical protein
MLDATIMIAVVGLYHLSGPAMAAELEVDGVSMNHRWMLADGATLPSGMFLPASTTLPVGTVLLAGAFLYKGAAGQSANVRIDLTVKKISFPYDSQFRPSRSGMPHRRSAADFQAAVPFLTIPS